MSYTYTYEVAFLVALSADNLEEANDEFHEIEEKLLSICYTPYYKSDLFHILDETGQTLFHSTHEFIPFPLSKY
jgi:hypothetical protein